jgi:mevalonate kinase
LSAVAPRSERRAVTTSAPGKLILAGEHAAVYGRPALVAAVDARLEVHATESDGSGIRLRLPAIGVDETVPAAALRDYAARARDRWQAFAADPNTERFRALRGGDAAHLAKVALGEALRAAGAAGDDVAVEARWTISVESAIPPGSGMGSSAAMAAALIAAALHLLGRDADLATVEPLVLETERRQHGSPSGVDGAVVLRGGVQWVERGSDGLRFEALPRDLALLGALRVVDTGTPAQPTGEVVAAVRERRDADPAAFDLLLERLETATRRLRGALVANDGPALADAIQRAQRGLERAGVVPPAIVELVRRIEGRGGAAKISGAGALAGDGAGCLVIYHPQPSSLTAGGLIAPERLLALRLGAAGLRRDA